jgi:osmotically-inducible protein OsmY
MPCLIEQPGVVAEQAERCLRCNAYLALKNVSCDYCEGVLTLRGCLPTYYLKQMAQTAVAQVEGVRQVVNLIQVTTPPSFPRAPHFLTPAGFR